MHYDTLIATLHGFAKKAEQAPLSLGAAIDSLENAAFPLIALILALPFMQPIPLGPLSIIGGFTFIALGWQCWRGDTAPTLPEKIRHIEMSAQTWDTLGALCAKVMHFCVQFTKPRLPQLVTGVQGRKIGAGILIASGVLMAIPFGGILPFNNMLPAFAILFYAVAQLEKDGAMIAISLLWLLITAIYFIAFFAVIWHIGFAAFSKFSIW
jgi:hypothetical protein